MPSLFSSAHEPLAARLRPRSIEEFFGQDHIVGPGRLLRRAIQADQISSLIFSGPPGTGKTTLALIVADRTKSQFISLNAVLSGLKQLREAIESARSHFERFNRKTILFVDEVHRWNKTQQDALLPWVENGTVILIGATTENPFFEVNRALLSRSRVFLLKPLSDADLAGVVDRALSDPVSGYGAHPVEIEDAAREHLIRSAAGDARTLLNAVELAVETGPAAFPPKTGETIRVTLADAEESIQQRAVLYDKDGDYHFDTISAYIKSVRGSDPDAALYWLARMVEAGESPRYIFRRLLVAASEDIGLADPAAIAVVNACAEAFERVGLPEGQYHLAHATLYLAAAEKSNSTLAYFDAVASVRREHRDVPRHLRDGSRDGAHLGHGENYAYPHAYRDHWVAQQYLPHSLQGTVFFHPGALGWEGERSSSIKKKRELQLAADFAPDDEIYVVTGKNEPQLARRIARNAPNAQRRIRDFVLDNANLLPHHRILIRGPGISPVVWESARRCPGGSVTAVPENANEAAAIRHFSSTMPEAERPLIVDPSDQTPFDHPMDRAIVRVSVHTLTDAEASADETVLTRTFGSLSESPEGLLLVLFPDFAAGTRLSNLLSLPETERRELQAAEEQLITIPTKNVPCKLDSSNSMSVTFMRTVTAADIETWFDQAAPLGALLPAETARTLKDKSLSTLVSSPLEWTRMYRLETFIST